jgi:hypothetical protein
MAALIALVVTAAFFAANYYSLGRGGEQRIGQAFTSGALIDDDFARGDTIRGYHQYNDCLILGLATDQRYSREELTVSPSVPFGPNDTLLCRALHYGRPDTDRFFYHNYLHGHTTLARYLLPILGVDQIRSLYRLLITLVIVTGLALALLRRNWVFAIVFLAFARCFGLEVFGQSLSHGPADLVLVSYVLFLLVGRPSVAAAAVFGSLTMIFEFMTGGLPLGLAVVIGLSGAALPAAVAFLVAAGVTLAVKYAAVLAVFGRHGLAQVFGALATHMGGTAPSYLAGRSWLQAIAGNMEALMPGLGPMAGLLLILAIVFGALGLHRRPTAEAKLLAWSNLPILLWFAAFRQHTIIHAWFMDRMFVWPIATGFAIYILSLRLERDDPPVVAQGRA